MQHALVIGAGITGVNCALALQSQGFSVAIADDRPRRDGASSGNAGCFALSEVAPISMPGLAWQVPSMLADPLGPLAIRWRYAPRMAPWFWRFWRAGRRDRVEAIARSLAWLLKDVSRDYAPLLEAASLTHLIRHEGTLFLYETTKGWEGSRYEWELKRRNGVEFREVSASEIREMEPSLAPVFCRGVHVPRWHHTVDPYAIVSGLLDLFLERGGTIADERVVAFTHKDGKLTGALTSTGLNLPFDLVVIAAGAWSRQLAGMLGQYIPLDTERGYNTTLPDPRINLSRPVCPAERGFFVTPMAAGLRIGGAVEFAGLKAEPDFRRAKAMLGLAERMLPGLNTEGGREWMGFRPSMPDSMPVIGRPARHPNAILAFGHGHLGLTLGATTGRLVADIARGRPCPAELRAFSPERF
jgi:D-amino-acid dehydrogenase